MNINRRKFFRVCGAGMAVAAIPKFLQEDKVQGKVEKPVFRAWEEKGFAVLDNRRVLQGGFEVDDDEAQLLRDGAITDTPPLWNIKQGRVFDEEELAAALKLPLRSGRMSKDILDQIYEVERLQGPEFPLDLPHVKDPEIMMTKVEVPTYDISGAIDWNIRFSDQDRLEILDKMARRLAQTQEEKLFTEIMEEEKARTLRNDMNEMMYFRTFGPEYGKPNRNGDVFVAPDKSDVEITIGLDTKTNEAKRIS